jgi:glycosyltransferase involved in cell wall biosynthesis
MVSIIIPTYNEEGYLDATLRNLTVNLTDFEHEIIVVDGGSLDATVSIAERYGVTLIRMGRSTIAKARNVGAERAKGDYFVFIDADVIIPDPNNFFRKAFGDFSERKNLAGLSVFFKTIPSFERRMDKFFRGAVNHLHVLNNNILHTGSASGEFMMVRADAFRAIHGFRGELVVAEDNDLFSRLQKEGVTFMDRSLTIFHSERRAHIIGWVTLYAIWTKNSLAWMFFNNHGASKEWKPIR